jgi:hypothetical protein
VVIKLNFTKKLIFLIFQLWIYSNVLAQDTINADKLIYNQKDSFTYNSVDNKPYTGLSKKMYKERLFSLDFYKNGRQTDTSKSYDWSGQMFLKTVYEENKVKKFIYCPINTYKEIIYHSAEVDSLPEYIGGYHAMMNFILNNFKYPQRCEDSQSISYFIGFVVEYNGTLSDIRIIRDRSIYEETELQNEALRVINIMPKWKPAIRANKQVNCFFIIPIKIKIE